MTQFTLKSARTFALAALALAAIVSTSAPASAFKGMEGMMGSIMENESVKGMMNDFTQSDIGKSAQQQFQGQGRKGGKRSGQGGLGGMLGGQGGSGMGLDQLQGLGSGLGLD